MDPLSFHTFYRILRDRTDKESNPLSGARDLTWPRGTKTITEMEGSIHSEHWELGWDKGASSHHLHRARAFGSSGIRAWNAHHAQSEWEKKTKNKGPGCSSSPDMSPWSPAWLAPHSDSQTLNSSLCYSEKHLLAVTASAGWKLPWAREVKALKCLTQKHGDLSSEFRFYKAL